MPLIPACSRSWGSVCVSEEFLGRLSSAAFSRFEAEFDRVPSVDLEPTDPLTLARLFCYLEALPFDEAAARAAVVTAEQLPLAWLNRFPTRKVG